MNCHLIHTAPDLPRLLPVQIHIEHTHIQTHSLKLYMHSSFHITKWRFIAIHNACSIRSVIKLLRLVFKLSGFCIFTVYDDGLAFIHLCAYEERKLISRQLLL